jgi:CHAT domain-containing protein/tetratricopeptide (TPR) repeat protein
VRTLLLMTLLTLASATGAPAQDPRPVDPLLLQRFIDADSAGRKTMAALPAVAADEFRIALQDNGSAHSRQGRQQEAVRSYEAALELSTLENNPKALIGSQIGLGMVYGVSGDYAKALSVLNAALAGTQEGPDDDLIAAISNNLGNIYRRRGEFDKALDTYQRALAMNERGNRQPQAARTLNNIGVVYQEQGDFRSALDYYLRSLALKERLNATDDIVSTVGNIGAVYSLQGNDPQAIDYFARSLALAEKSNDVRFMISMSSNLGRVLLESGDFAAAEARFTRAIALAERGGFSDELASVLTSAANLDVERRQWSAAEQHLARAEAILTRSSDPTGMAQVLLGRAKMEIDRGRPEVAAAIAQQARDALAALGTPTSLIDAEVLAGDAYSSLARWNDAIATYQRAIGLVERGLALVAGDAEDRFRFLETGDRAYAGLVHAYASSGRASEALAAAERGRARTLLDMLAAGGPDSAALSDVDRERRIELDTSLAALNQRVAADRVRRQRGATPDPSLASQLDRLRQSRDEFYLGLDAKYPRLKFARGEAPVLTEQELAAALPPRSALVEFAIGAKGAWILLLRPQANGQPRLIVKAAGLPPSRLLALGAEFTRQVASRDLGFSADAHALYDALFGPVDAELAGVGQLILVPQGGLWQVPFQALQSRRNKFVVEEHAIAYAPSASALKALKSRRRPPAARPRVIAFGDPRVADKTIAALPNAAREAREVAAIYGGASVVATDSDASEARFRQLAPRADIVHIATHGVFDNTSPLFSYLMLSGAGTQRNADGRLEARELINMQLGADLVVLSACETARGRIANGEGVVGLSWALFAAGASTTTLSLWPVDSASTTDLMSAFHRERRRLMAVSPAAATARALQAAQRQLLEQPASRHPFYWAGFVVIGIP